MTTADSAPRSQPAATARQWQLAHGRDAVEWMRSSGTAQRMLADVCAAVETTVEWLVQGDSQRARWVIRQYPRVLTSCDVLQFNDPAQALAYLILHLSDRCCRMFQVLERLLLSARLPPPDMPGPVPRRPAIQRQVTLRSWHLPGPAARQVTPKRPSAAFRRMMSP
jgi:hypothetical protein